MHPSNMQSPQLPDALGHGVADKRIDILRAIARRGSISQAARDVAVSYKAAWQAVDTLTNLAGVPLVNRAVGGSGGGGASLTAQGQQLLDLADMLGAARQHVHDRWSAAAGGRTQVDGSLQTTQSAHARLSLRTSMRNQFPCTVVSMAVVGRIVRVGMQLGDGNQQGDSDPMTARITTESAELLGLAAGMTVIALCKATAVRVQPHKATRAQATGNRLLGQVTDVAPDEGGDEVTVQLAGGLQLVGFAPAGLGMVQGQQARVEVDEAAVVVALPG